MHHVPRHMPHAPQLAVAPPREPLREVRRIAVLRAGGLGDVLFALPAMRALAARYPEAEVTLLGTRLAAELFDGRPGAPHRVLPLPPVPGVGVEPGVSVDESAVAGFLAERRAERYDLAVQMHGGGRFSNALLRELGAACTIGTRTPDAPPLDRSLDYVYYQHEVLRWLEVAGLVGAAPVELEPRVYPVPAEFAFARRRLGDERPVVVLHPGATDPRRRWPVERFARVAAALVDDGVRVVLVGAGDEDRASCARIAAIAAEVAEASVARRLIDDASDALSLRELTGVLAAADAMVGNDSGPRHLAQAVGTRTASVFWCGNLLNAGPFGRERHRVRISWTTRCPVCGRDCTQVGWTAERCEHDDSFVGDVGVEGVLEDVRDLLAGAGDAAGADRAATAVETRARGEQS